MPVRKTVFDRNALYEEVWREPMTVVAKRYGLSDVALHRICKKLNVPVPGRGYWAKLKAGGKVERLQLPKPTGPQAYVSERPDDAGMSSTQADPLAFLDLAVRQKLEEVCSSIVVPDQFTRPHPLVAELAKRLRGSRTSVNVERYETPHHVLDVSVTKSSVDRALRIMDTLMKSLEKAGYVVGVDQKSSKTYVEIGQERLRVHLKERTRQVEHVLTPDELKAKEKGRYIYTPRFDYLPTGELTLSIDSWVAQRKNWTDGKQHRLEEQLGKFVLGLVLAAEHERRWKEERLAEEQRRIEAERRRIEQKRLREEELSRFSRLREAAEDWQAAEMLRRYIGAVERKPVEQHNPEHEERIREWAAWSRAKADWLDPLTAKGDPILGNRWGSVDD